MEALRHADPVFLVLGIFGVAGIAVAAMEKLGLIPPVRIVSGTPTRGVTIRRRG